MCDAFRGNPLWQFMTGGNWVAHPGGDGVRYRVRITDRENPLTDGIDDFEVATEQYYLHVDPVEPRPRHDRLPDRALVPLAQRPGGDAGRLDRRLGAGPRLLQRARPQAGRDRGRPPREMLRRGLLWARRARRAPRGRGSRRCSRPAATGEAGGPAD